MQDIRIHDIHKTYQGKSVLNGLTLTLPAGRASAIMGPSGVGKTTLLRLMMGLEKPDRGTITGIDEKRISIVFQEDRLLEYLDVMGNLHLVAPDLRDEDAIEALSAVRLYDCARQPAHELSGGMKRRVALLRALLAPSDLLLLDEPFKGLDEETMDAAIAYTRKRTADKTVVLVTHDPGEAERLRAQIYVLGENGQIER